jgi:hypothetical protein
MKLTDRKTKLVFTTNATVEYLGQQRPIIVEPSPEGIVVRLSDCSIRYTAPWRLVFNVAKRETARVISLRKKKTKLEREQAELELLTRKEALLREVAEIDAALV